jgi:hypothetical protein
MCVISIESATVNFCTFVRDSEYPTNVKQKATQEKARDFDPAVVGISNSRR